MISEKVIAYIKELLNKGQSLENIKASLMDEGWQPTIIEENMNAVKSDPLYSQHFNTPVEQQLSKTREPKKRGCGFWILVSVFLTILINGLYFGYHKMTGKPYWSVETAPGVTISTKNATPNSQSSTQANPPNPSDLDITKWISTNDGIAKITYKYPASWQNGGGGEGTTNGGYYNTNFTYSPQRPRPGATNRIYDFSVNTYQTATDLPQNNGAKNLSEWLEKSGPSYGITNKEDFVLGGIKGYKTMVTGTVPIQYWFERGSLITHVNIYTSDSYGQKEIGEKIFSTLTFN